MKLASLLGPAAALTLCAGSAFAAPLNLVPGLPDASSGFVAINYNATTDTLTATGQTQNLAPGAVNLGLRVFSLSATIDAAGNISGPASLTVRGDFGGTDQLLFSSNNLLAFGFGALNKFEFQFASNGTGSLAPLGSIIGTTVVNQAGLTFPGGVPSFQNSFASVASFPGGPQSGTADTFIPAPSGLAAIGAAGVLATRRRRR